MSSKDSLSHTIKVVLGVSLVCSIVVSMAAVGLKPMQVANKTADKQKNILAVSGVEFSLKTLTADYKKAIEVKYVELNTGEYTTEVAANYEQRLAAKDPKQSIKLSSKDDVAGILRRANIAPVYMVKDDNGQLSRVILPIHGAGLWSTMYAFVALKPDGNTIEAITYYDQGETPGLGGEVENPKWRSVWEGKQLFNQAGEIAINVVKGQADVNSNHDVDGLSGATLTANGVQHSFDFWMGPKGFGPFLKKLQADASSASIKSVSVPVAEPAAVEQVSKEALVDSNAVTDAATEATSDEAVVTESPAIEEALASEQAEVSAPEATLEKEG